MRLLKLLIIFVLIFVPNQVEAMPRNVMVSRMLNSSVKIKIVNDNLGEVGGGSGFSIKTKDGSSYILTNAHVCAAAAADGLSIYGERSVGRSKYEIPVVFKLNISNFSITHDLCLLTATTHISPVLFSKKGAKVFDKTFTVGSPSGNFPVIIESYVSNFVARAYLFKIMNAHPYDYLFLSQQSEPGHSGSPVFNRHGKLIGIIFANINSQVMTEVGIMTVKSYGTMCISTEEIISFLEAVDVNF